MRIRKVMYEFHIIMRDPFIVRPNSKVEFGRIIKGPRIIIWSSYIRKSIVNTQNLIHYKHLIYLKYILNPDKFNTSIKIIKLKQI